MASVRVDTSGYPGLDEQDRILKDAATAVKKNAYFMRKAAEEDNLREALRYSVQMLGELRTSMLSPHKYYELYMQVFDELGNLEAFFADERKKGRSFAELYELVQQAGNVLPRLYLMVAVGCLYIRSDEAKPNEILKDLVDMCKGVQHPTRGLFLRSYLCQRSRGLLPDTGSKFEGQGGDIHDAIDFLLSNFIEMNKLWVRMQHQGSVRDKEKREKQRQQLQDLVGKNLTYLSQLDGLDFKLYSETVLARVIEQIVSCKDDIAQQYLMQCVIQGFPDAFHLGTLDSLLGALAELQAGVKVHNVMSSLMDRLARYAATDPSVMEELLARDAFEKFKGAIDKITTMHTEMPAAEVVEMYVALMNFTESVHTDKLENVDKVLGACHAALSANGLGKEAKAEKHLVNLLTMPLTKYDVVTVLSLNEYPLLMTLLQHKTYKELSVKIVQTVLDQAPCISSAEKVDMLFKFITPLVQDVGDVSAEDIDEEDFEEEQMLMARLLHRFHSDDVDEHFGILQAARVYLEKGGPTRLRHTLPALVFCTLRVIRRLCLGAAARDGPPPGVSAESMLQWLLEACFVLADVPEPMMALRLLLCCAHVASEEAKLEMLAYEFFEQAFTLYEESIAGSRQKVVALQAILGTLHRCYIFSDENRDALVQSATSYSSKLLKRSDQCRAVCACSHLSWQNELPADAAGGEAVEGEVKPVAVRDGAKVLGCLKRAIKIANAAKTQMAATARLKEANHVVLYVEILNHYLYYFSNGNEMMTSSVVQQFLELVQGEISHNAETVDEETTSYWRNTCRHIMYQKSRDGDVRQKFSALSVTVPP